MFGYKPPIHRDRCRIWISQCNAPNRCIPYICTCQDILTQIARWYESAQLLWSEGSHDDLKHLCFWPMETNIINQELQCLVVSTSNFCSSQQKPQWNFSGLLCCATCEIQILICYLCRAQLNNQNSCCFYCIRTWFYAHTLMISTDFLPISTSILQVRPEFDSCLDVQTHILTKVL